MTRDEIVAEAKTYMNVRWRHTGRTRTGVDCAGLICCVADRFGVVYQDLQGYGRQPDGRFAAQVMRFLPLRQPQEIAHGSVVVLRDGPLPCHIGIIEITGGAPYLIHSSLGARPPRVVREEWTSRWQSRLRCVLDFPGVEDLPSHG